MTRRRTAFVVLAALSLAPHPAAAQTAGCQTVTSAAATAAHDEINYLRNNVRKPQSVKNLTCLTALMSVTSLTADALVLSIEDQILTQIVTQICNALNNYWQELLNQLNCGISAGIGVGFPNLGLGGGVLCQFNVGGYGNSIHLNAGIGPNGSGYYINGMANPIQEYGR